MFLPAGSGRSLGVTMIHIAGGLDDAPVMLADFRIDQFAQMRLEALVRAFLIGTHQARITHHIGGEDRSETAGYGRGGHCSHQRSEMGPTCWFAFARTAGIGATWPFARAPAKDGFGGARPPARPKAPRETGPDGPPP